MTRSLMPISSQQAEDIERICAAPPDSIAAVDRTLGELRSQIRPSRLFVAASQALNDPVLAKTIVRQGLLLSSYARRARQSGAEVVAALQKSLPVNAEGWTADRVRNYGKHWYALGSLVENNNIYCAAKALELSYDHDRVLTNARIVTDIRPVLDRTRDSPLGAVLIHSLHLDYYGNNETVEMTVALDEEDLKSLINSCEEALRKTQASKKLIVNATDDNVFVYGEEDYGFTEA
jgi:hypothetical protein